MDNDTKVRDRLFQCWMSQDEHLVLKRLAARLGGTKSSLVRGWIASASRVQMADAFTEKAKK